MSEEPGPEEVAALQSLFEEAERKGQKLRRVQLVLTLGLAVVVVGFLAAIYGKAESMYTKEKFQASLQPQLEELRPHLEATARDVIQTAGTEIVKLGKARLELVLPKISEAMEAELVGLTDGLAQRSEQRVSEALERVQMAQFDRLRERFPELDDKRFAELRKQWAVEIQQDATEVLGGFRDRVLDDFATLNVTIEGFSPNEYDDFERDELVRYYAHLWLTLADEEVLTGEVEGGRDG